MTEKDKLKYEFADKESNTYSIIDWGKYIEIVKVLINIDKEDGSIINEVSGEILNRGEADEE